MTGLLWLVEAIKKPGTKIEQFSIEEAHLSEFLKTSKQAKSDLYQAIPKRAPDQGWRRLESNCWHPKAPAVRAGCFFFGALLRYVQIDIINWVKAELSSPTHENKRHCGVVGRSTCDLVQCGESRTPEPAEPPVIGSIGMALSQENIRQEHRMIRA